MCSYLLWRFWPRGERTSTSVSIALWGVRGVVHFDINLNEILAPAASYYTPFQSQNPHHFRCQCKPDSALAGSDNALFLSGNPRERPSSLSAFGITAIIFDVVVNQVLPPAGSGNARLLLRNPRERPVSLAVLWCRRRSFRRQMKADPAPRGERKHSLRVKKPP
ncbi:hypothetical protein Hypma_004948 [Hypsizygus marmoreus]|uniref:Uncharacterized protein n=1 Tax=Hypsizygus marmoreus TaxID=39966 RepID=A0A369JXH2_HYPMA|nr:hypothetical protein Hypma_004948 [Hypsizygus marmoreus]